MALKVQVVAPSQGINTSIRKVSLSLVNLEELKNVDTTNLQDGYTLVWNETDQQWVTQQVQVSAADLSIDGGTY